MRIPIPSKSLLLLYDGFYNLAAAILLCSVTNRKACDFRP